MLSIFRSRICAALFVVAAVNCVNASSGIVPLGKLEGFWRYSAALGPYHEVGQGLEVVPACMLTGDFPYPKRPFSKEALFADHLSVVRILGGFKAPQDAEKHSDLTDLAYRGDDGQICYRMELLRPRLKPYIDNGYTDLTIVLDNVPWCFPENPADGSFGQRRPPAKSGEWHEFVQVFCRELVDILGKDQANGLRFRVGTENGSHERFDGTHDEYVRHYENTAAAVRSVLPEARIGCYNISGVSVQGIRHLHNVRALDLAKQCLGRANQFDRKGPTPFDWVAYSRYYRPGDDPVEHAKTCGVVWDLFESTVPKLKGVSREIHEFGIAPWGEVAKGVFASSEPGVLGAALTCQMMLRLREVGISRLWHWGVLDRYRNSRNELVSLPTGEAWLLSVLERMRGSQSYLLSPVGSSKSKTSNLALAGRTENRVVILISSYNRDIKINSAEQVTFSLPGELRYVSGDAVYVARLNRESSVHDNIRVDLQKAGLLVNDFVERPERLGSIRQMGASKSAEHLIGDNHGRYEKIWTESMTLKPADKESFSFKTVGVSGAVTLTLAPPELVVLSWNMRN